MAETYYGVDWGAAKPEVVALRQMVLERLRTKTNLPVTLEVREQPQAGPNELADRVAEELLFMLTTELAAHNHWTDRHLYEFPVSWWDHWKLQACPRWLKPLFKPPRMDAIYEELRAYRVCPHLQMPKPMDCVRWLADG